jgi:hypothetical protein
MLFVIMLCVCAFVMLGNAKEAHALAATSTYDVATQGTSFVVPAGITSITVKAWAGGGVIRLQVLILAAVA